MNSLFLLAHGAHVPLLKKTRGHTIDSLLLLTLHILSDAPSSRIVSCMYFFLFHCLRLGCDSPTFYINHDCKSLIFLLISSFLKEPSEWSSESTPPDIKWLRHLPCLPVAVRSRFSKRWLSLAYDPDSTLQASLSIPTKFLLTSESRSIFHALSSPSQPPSPPAKVVSILQVQLQSPMLNKSFPKTLSYSLVSSLLCFHRILLISLMTALNILLHISFLHSTMNFPRASVPPICLNKTPVQRLLHSTWLWMYFYMPSHLLVR